MAKKYQLVMLLLPRDGGDDPLIASMAGKITLTEQEVTIVP